MFLGFSQVFPGFSQVFPGFPIQNTVVSLPLIVAKPSLRLLPQGAALRQQLLHGHLPQEDQAASGADQRGVVLVEPLIAYFDGPWS